MNLGNLFKKNKPKRPDAVRQLSDEPQRIERLSPKTEGRVSMEGNIGIGMSTLVLRGVHVTEKARNLNSLNQYVFKVAAKANKIEIKKTVEKVYGVKVDRVMISVMPAKKRRLGRQEGEKSGFKKAIVKLSEGSKIDMMIK